MSIGKRPTQYLGVLPKNPPNVIFADRAPVNGTDKAFNPGDLWVDQNSLAVWQFAGVAGAIWIALGTGATGGIVTINGNAPVAGDYTLAGTAAQIVVTESAGTSTLSLADDVTIVGSLLTGTTLEATTGITAGTTITATAGNITASAGNIAATLGSVSAGTSVTAGTTITATAGDITATLGHIVVNGAAKQFKCHGGAATDFIGTATLVNGVATVLNTNIKTTDRIFVTRSAKNASTAYGTFEVVKTASTNFVITSCKSDTTTETNDQSTVEYFIVAQV